MRIGELLVIKWRQGREDSRSCELACLSFERDHAAGRVGGVAGDAQIPGADVSPLQPFLQLRDEERMSPQPSSSIPTLHLGSTASSAG